MDDSHRRRIPSGSGSAAAGWESSTPTATASVRDQSLASKEEDPGEKALEVVYAIDCQHTLSSTAGLEARRSNTGALHPPAPVLLGALSEL